MKRTGIVVGVILMLVASGHSKEPSPEKAAPEKPQKPVRIFLLSGQSNMVGYGDKEPIVFLRPELLAPRDDVWTVGGSIPGRPLSGGGEGRFGVELTMGHKLGDALDEPVVFIKAAWPGKSLWIDFRPPSAVAKRGGEIGGYYNSMMDSYARAFQHLDMFLPELAGRAYEISGFVWFQGEADSNRGNKDVWGEYEANMKDLLHDIRTTFGVPKMPAVIIQINDGKDGVEPAKPDENGNYSGWHYITEAQKKVADDDPHAAWVLTLDQSRFLHYDSASYLNIGDRCGDKMLALLKEDAKNHRDSEAIKELIKQRITDKIEPPMAEKPDMKALCKGLYGYFPFDGYAKEEYEDGRGRKRTRDTIPGAAVQSVAGYLGSPVKDMRTPSERHRGVRGKKQDLWVDGIQGQAVRLRGSNLIHFPGFKEPVDKKGLLGDMTVSFWAQTNSKRTRGYRLGRGAGYRLQTGNLNWFRSWEANYAGWDIIRVGSHGESSFTTTLERSGCHGIRVWGFARDGIRWSHLLVTYNRKTGEKSFWVNGEKHASETLEKGAGIIAADAPLAIGVLFGDVQEFMSFDELCMWDRVLRDAEIKTLYNNGHGIALPK